MGRKAKPLKPGKRYGNLYVIRRAKSNPTGTQMGLWKFRCKCGRELQMSGSDAAHGRRKNCPSCSPAKRRIDPTTYMGAVYGRWTVLRPSESNQKGLVSGTWIASCQCGTKREVWLAILRSGKSKSCGCYRSEVLMGKTALTPKLESCLGILPDIHIARAAGVSRERVRQWRMARGISRPKRIGLPLGKTSEESSTRTGV